LDDAVLPSPVSTPHIFPTDMVATAISAPTQVNALQPTPENPDKTEIGTLWKGDQMPIFLEVTQTTIMKTDSAQGPTLGVGPAVYFYNPDENVLRLQSTITLAFTTELLIGMNNVLQTPGQVYEKKALIQYPSAQSDLIQISAFDAETGMLRFVFDGEAYDLPAGESHTFKQVGSEPDTSTVITVVSNHGLLSDIQLTSPDGSWR
jgi:hypothetical protein